MKKCIHLDELKRDGTKICRLFIDWKAEYTDKCMVIEETYKLDDRYCMCEMFQEDV